jgi:type II secretory pathway component PulK
MLSVLVILIGQFQYSTNVDARIAENYAADRENYYAARGALNLANAFLIKDFDENQIDTLDDDWADSARLSGISIGSVSTVTEVKDQERFLNINRLHLSGKLNDLSDPTYREYLWTKNALARLITVLNIDPDNKLNLVERISDWIDEDSDGNYEEGTRNRGLTTVEEMLQIPGITAAILYGTSGEEGNNRTGLASYITLWGRQQGGIYQININTAPQEILESISDKIDQQKATDIVNYRKDNPFTSPDDLTKVAQEEGGSPVLEKIFDKKEGDPELKAHLTVRSTFFEVSIEATKGYMKMRVEAVVYRDVKREGTFIRQLFWKERQM